MTTNDLPSFCSPMVLIHQETSCSTVYRVLYRDEENLHLMAIGRIEPGRRKYLAIALSGKARPPIVRFSMTHVESEMLKGTFRLQRHVGISNEMGIDRGPARSEQLEKRLRYVYEVLKKIGPMAFTRSPAAKRTCEEVAWRHNVSSETVRKWVDTYAYYGGHPNALMTRQGNFASASTTPNSKRRKKKDTPGQVSLLRNDSPFNSVLGRVLRHTRAKERRIALVQNWGDDNEI